jgi:hypothetical protein
MAYTNFNKEILAFNKRAIKTSFDALSAFSGQAASATESLLGATPAVPEEGKKAVSMYLKEGQKSLASLEKLVDGGLELDWTGKDAPVKNLDLLESFYKDALSQAIEIRKETKVLVEKATMQLPKEAKSLVDFWNDSFNNGFEFFQSYVDKNFDLARKVMTDVSVVTPGFVLKAAESFVQDGTKRAKAAAEATEAFVHDEIKKAKAGEAK